MSDGPQPPAGARWVLVAFALALLLLLLGMPSYFVWRALHG